MKYIHKLIMLMLIGLIFAGCAGKLEEIAKDGDIDTIKEEVKSIEDKQKLLLWSARYGKIDKVKYLLKNGADINDGAIRAAATGNNLNMVKYLLKHGADIDNQSQYGYTAASIAATWGNLSIVKYLAEQGADLYAGKGFNTISKLKDNGHEYFIPVVLNIQKERKAKLEKQQVAITQQIVPLQQKNSDLNDIPALLKKSESAQIDNSKWLFIVAIEDYEFTDSVKYSANSAKQFKKVMKKRLGVPEKNIRTLINRGATSGKIRYHLKDIVAHVKKGDTIYFYYSGHGIPVPSQKNAPYLLAQDMSPQYVADDERFKLQNIYKSLSNSKASKVVAFIDSCFSGGTDNQALIKGVAATRVKPKKVMFDKTKMLVISAGSGTQYSNKYDDKSNRLFSYYLMRGLIKNNSNINRLYDYVKSNVQEKSYEMGASSEQIPVYDGNIRLKF